MFPSRAPRAFVLILRAAALLLVCLIPQGCQDQGGSGAAAGQTLSPYMRKCLESEVPVPPDWGDSKWERQADLDSNKVFDAGNGGYTSTQVWVYRSDKPKGICYALPRMRGSNIILLGMICQGESGNACFWDNKRPGTETEITPSNGMKPAEMADGSNLIEKCVDCHRGDNAFAITPGTSLQLDYPGKKVDEGDEDGRPTSVSRPPYRPISTWPDPRPGWVNEPNGAPPPSTRPVPPPASTPAPPASTYTPSASVKLDGGCNSCHAIPKLTPKYCRLVMKMTAKDKDLMPPGGLVAGSTADDDLKKIKQACNELSPGMWP